MPYITQDRRKLLTDGYANPNIPGELNYIITTYLRDYALSKGTSYQTHNDIIGVLECAKQEWYRRCTAPYEDYKCNENGDVYV